MKKNVVFDESVTLEELEQQRVAVKNASLRITKEQVNWVYQPQSVPGDDEALIQVAAEALGTDSPELAFTTIRQMIDLHGGNKTYNIPMVNAGLALLSGFGCKDPLELMLAVQLISLHTRAIELAIKDATKSSFFPGEDNLDETLKVMRVFQSVMQTLNKHRRTQI